MQGIKTVKSDNIVERKKNQTAIEIKTQWMNLTAEWTKQRIKAYKFQLLSFKVVVLFPHLNIQIDSLSQAFTKEPEEEFTRF